MPYNNHKLSCRLLAEKLEKLKQEDHDITTDLSQLQSDDKFLKRRLRRELMLAEKDDVVYRFVKEVDPY